MGDGRAYGVVMREMSRTSGDFSGVLNSFCLTVRCVENIIKQVNRHTQHVYLWEEWLE